MNEKDIRVQKTNLKLSEVFLALLEDEWVTKITINQICQQANVHRTTFYKHFKDKYDLLYYVSQMALKPYFSLGLDMRLQEPFNSIDRTIDQQILKILHTQKEDPRFYQVVTKSFYDYFQQELIRYEAQLPSKFPFPIEVFSYVYAATIRSINQWCTDYEIQLDAYYRDEIFRHLMNFSQK
ncbi:TetR/AcrR family transcriptional regulator [Staphylococcus intermedius]|nr:TetR/AcrR family transcriptional regulator [Staphylococcus intermedius]PCF63803.1 TetR family transcriptional regulator [Staphylococcus intermedius]PCF78518.1 TetR family transcriptional regulator [Staphylococcus intermedius]PCF79491.1 TetR family transcriptional regulator [Staphylococcus intermedius]PCF86772.1 TetR family transcriptional regulator [Staphylococcus intermedius]PCF89851.1 TetR family transcriptional regulator [Staphylococcus intermedius]